jgi:endonuclease YncB( thermonuclease family)
LRIGELALARAGMCDCREVTYCSVECRGYDWVDHAKECALKHREFAHPPKPHEIEHAVKTNKWFRRVLYTDTRVAGAHTQQVAMSLGYGCGRDTLNIGWEQHVDTAQYFAVVEGKGVLYSGTSSDKTHAYTEPIGVGSKWLITPGTWHDVEGRIKLLTIYYPAHHPRHTADVTRDAAEARERASAQAPPDGNAYTEDVTIAIEHVIDGDTVIARRGDTGGHVHVRLTDIDAPELCQCFGQESRVELERILVSADRVVLRTFNRHDKYGRLLGWMYALKGDELPHTSTRVSLMLVERGCAWPYIKYLREEHGSVPIEYEEAFNRARANRVGMWTDPPEINVPPWMFRHNE